MKLEINGAMLNIIDSGKSSAPPVVFVHGFPFSHMMWHHQLPVVAGEFRTIAYDVRGLGESSPGDGLFTIEGHVDDLIAIMDYLQISRATIVGLSMGGYITLRALERNPERFSAAVLCDTRSEADTNEGRLSRALSVAEVKEHGSAFFAAGFLKKVFAPGSFQEHANEIELISDIISRTPPLSIAATLVALAARTDTTASLKKINIPTLIMVGELDTTTPPDASRAMHEQITGSELHIIPDAAHMSPLENPSVANKCLMDFLELRIKSS
jgi:3-oxoadipate enol-lactonase